MVITRKIEVFICEDDKDLRDEYYKRMYDIRYAAVKAANITVSHLFALNNTMPYLSPEDKEKVTFLGVKGDKATKRNAPYVAVSEVFKGKVNLSWVPSLLQVVQKSFDEDMKRGMWERSLRSYKSDIPVPFKACQYKNLRFAEYTDKEGATREGCFFELMTIPFKMRFGRDRSGNRIIVQRIVSGEYEMRTSSIQVVKNKMFLLLCVDIPQKENKVDEKKTMYAYLGQLNPIICTCDVRAAQEYDSGYKWYEIGTKEEFNYRRRQIQDACRRCQVNNRYSKGGKGRKKKTQAIERFHEKENNYVDTKLHIYSKMLIDLAVKHGCGCVVLMNETHREKEAKDGNANGEPLVLRNWSYYGLKEKISYKAKMNGIRLVEEE